MGFRFGQTLNHWWKCPKIWPLWNFFYHFLSNLGTIQMDDFIDTFNKKVESTIWDEIYAFGGTFIKTFILFSSLITLGNSHSKFCFFRSLRRKLIFTKNGTLFWLISPNKNRKSSSGSTEVYKVLTFSKRSPTNNCKRN